MHPTKTISLDKEMFKDIMRVKEEFDSVMESIELMSNEEFMKSYKDAKEEIKDRDFADWDELTADLE